MTVEKMNDFIKENRVDGEQVYIIIRNDNDNTMSRFVMGFNATELLGILFETQMDIMAQMRGELKPTIETFRTVFVKQEATE